MKDTLQCYAVQGSAVHAGAFMNKTSLVWRSNIQCARRVWGQLPSTAINALKQLTRNLAVSVAAGDLQFLENRWYVTHSGLLRIAQRRKCRGIETAIQDHLSDPQNNKWVIKATVFKSRYSKGFAGYGDADPSNVSPMVHGAEMRVAETRAVNRALRKAYGIGLCSVEELGALSSSPRPSAVPSPLNGAHSNGSGNGQPRLRDRLCLLIRQYSLDANLVRAYAADFCGTAALSGASRELVESFITHLTAAAKDNRDALVCKLNSYAQPVEAKS
jgi:hypothetical protein